MTFSQNFSIRSFVRRAGKMTDRQKRGLEECASDFVRKSEEGLLDYAGAFGNGHEVVLEIGFGMGKSLLAMAKEHPEINFIGVEVHKPGVGSLLADISENSIKNILIYQEDCIEILKQCIALNSLSKIMIFFPDPWPKKRHWKRRLIQPGFVDLLIDRLKPGGQLHLATDWQDYAEQMMHVLSAFPQLQNLAGEGKFIQNEGFRPRTKFEQRGCRLGHSIFDLLFKRL